MLKQAQTQKLSQKILPGIIQRQNLLSVPVLALEQMIRSEMEVNPFLEEDLGDSNEESPATEPDESNISEEYDWDDFYGSEYEGYKTKDRSFEVNSVIEDQWKENVTIYDKLMSQLHQSMLSEKDIFIGEEIIGNIDEDGYLREDTEQITDELNRNKTGTEFEGIKFTPEDVERVITAIHKFEPAGIGARNLKECLLIQLSESEIQQPLKGICEKIINDYFEELRLRNYEKIISSLNISEKQVKDAFEIIVKLNPKPGYDESEDVLNFIYPDVIVRKRGEKFLVSLNEKNFLPLRINKEYGALLSGDSGKSDKQTREFLKSNYERAKWFLDAVRSRRETILKVMNSILYRQINFFENNGEGLKPMTEQEIADDINMDVSTVSRTVRGKYVQTDFGIYELKYFFSNSLQDSEGDDISTKEIKNKILELIRSENKKNPYTDDKLVSLMTEMGFNIARRTVAKYRESLKIPKARLRRRLN